MTELNLSNHDDAGVELAVHAEKLCRDGMVWSHLAGDSVQRMRTIRRILA